MMQIQAGKYAAAQQHLDEVLSIRRELLGEKNNLTADSWINAAEPRLLLGNYAEARRAAFTLTGK